MPLLEIVILFFSSLITNFKCLFVFVLFFYSLYMENVYFCLKQLTFSLFKE